jgi:hypothetical protein
MAWHKRIDGAPELPEGLWYKTSYMGFGMIRVAIRPRRLFSGVRGESWADATRPISIAAEDAVEDMKNEDARKEAFRENSKWL